MTFKEILQNAYEQLINYRKLHKLYKRDDYCESHHIVPRSFGGSNKKENLVNLKAREHYLAHYMLWKIWRGTQNGYKMAKAFCKLCKNKDGLHVSAEEYELAKRALSDSMKGNSWNKGKKHSEKQNKKQSDAIKGRKWWTNGVEETQAFECPNGWTHGRLKKGYHLSEEQKQILSNANKGKPAWNRGIPSTEESKRKNHESNKGLVYWNDGSKTVRAKECPEGFVRGRLTNDTYWFTNGVEETQAFECPEGFVCGRLKKSV